jgi:xylulose-5-phosphate/fructose-6-phosphate phosphoketolase
VVDRARGYRALELTPPPLLPPGELRGLDALWRAANYLSVGQIHLSRTPLLREPPALEQIKRALPGA